MEQLILSDEMLSSDDWNYNLIERISIPLKLEDKVIC